MPFPGDEHQRVRILGLVNKIETGMCPLAQWRPESGEVQPFPVVLDEDVHALADYLEQIALKPDATALRQSYGRFAKRLSNETLYVWSYPRNATQLRVWTDRMMMLSASAGGIVESMQQLRRDLKLDDEPSGGASQQSKKKKTGRGSAPKYDPLKTEKLVNDWKSTNLSQAEYEREHGLDEGAIERAQYRLNKQRKRG